MSDWTRERLLEEISGCKYLAFFLLFVGLGGLMCVLIVFALVPTMLSLAQQPPATILLAVGVVVITSGVSLLAAKAILSLPPIEKKP
jgi:hypothetical protein